MVLTWDFLGCVQVRVAPRRTPCGNIGGSREAEGQEKGLRGQKARDPEDGRGAQVARD